MPERQPVRCPAKGAAASDGRRTSSKDTQSSRTLAYGAVGGAAVPLVAGRPANSARHLALDPSLGGAQRQRQERDEFQRFGGPGSVRGGRGPRPDHANAGRDVRLLEEEREKRTAVPGSGFPAAGPAYPPRLAGTSPASARMDDVRDCPRAGARGGAETDPAPLRGTAFALCGRRGEEAAGDEASPALRRTAVALRRPLPIS